MISTWPSVCSNLKPICPIRDLRSSSSTENAKSQPLDQWPVTRPRPLTLQKWIPIKCYKIMKQELIGRKKCYTHTGRLREIHSWWPEVLIWDISSGFWPVSLALPGSESVFVLSQGLPMCTRASAEEACSRFPSLPL